MLGDAAPPQKARYWDLLGPLIDNNFRQQPSAAPAFAQMTGEIAANTGRLLELRRSFIKSQICEYRSPTSGRKAPWWERMAPDQRRGDCVPDSSPVLHHVVVLEPQNSPSLPPELGVLLLIATVSALSAVHFDNRVLPQRRRDPRSMAGSDAFAADPPANAACGGGKTEIQEAPPIDGVRLGGVGWLAFGAAARQPARRKRRGRASNAHRDPFAAYRA